MSKTKSKNNNKSQKKKVPAYILAAYVLVLIAINAFIPEFLSTIDWWIYLPILPILIWFIVASRQDNR